MGFVKTMDEIMARVGKRAEFYDAEMLTVLWLTRPEIVASLLPHPLEPIEAPLVAAFVANYPNTNFSIPYKEAALFLMARYQDEVGSYCLSMPVDDDMAMAGGREVFGYPKKMAQIHFDKNENYVEGWVERHGVRYFKVNAQLTETPNESLMGQLANWGSRLGAEEDRVAFNFKYFPSPEGQGFDYNPRLIRETVTFHPEIQLYGEPEITLAPSDHDPWAQVEIKEILGAIYTKGNNTMNAGKVVAECDLMAFLPHAFLKWDLHNG